MIYEQRVSTSVVTVTINIEDSLPRISKRNFCEMKTNWLGEIMWHAVNVSNRLGIYTSNRIVEIQSDSKEIHQERYNRI